MSAASFHGIAGLIALFGYDGFLYSVGWLVAYLVVLLIVAEPLRNSGRYTIADMLAYRMKAKPVRSAAALSTLAISTFYMIAQLVGAGGIIKLLLGIDYEWSIIIIGVLMILYVAFGGMLATTWVQIVKAVLLMTGTILLSSWSWPLQLQPVNMFNEVSAKYGQVLEPGLQYDNLDNISGHRCWRGRPAPHILIRFYTVPSAREARISWCGHVHHRGFYRDSTTRLARRFADGEHHRRRQVNMATLQKRCETSFSPSFRGGFATILPSPDW